MSISDDDLCSDCQRCVYRPGGDSDCIRDWPGEFDANGYCQKCVDFVPVKVKGENIESTA